MGLFEPGDTVTTSGSFQIRCVATANADKYRPFDGKSWTGLVYRYDRCYSNYVYVFFPELPGGDYRLHREDEPMILACYGFYESELVREGERGFLKNSGKIF